MKFSKELKAGLIAIFAIVGFVILFQFMKGKNLFSSDNLFYVKYDNVEGLDVSNAVSINGLKVGQVDEIKPILSKDGRMHFVVKMTIANKFHFSKTSTAEIFEPGIMSGKQLRINLAYGGDIAKDGDTINGKFQLSMLNSLSAQVGPVKDQVTGVLSKLDSTLASAHKLIDGQNRAEIKALLSNLNRTVQSFEGTSKQTNLLLANNDPKLQKVLDNANLATISAKNSIDKFGNVADNIDTKKLNNAIDKLSLTADKLNGVISGIQNGEGSLGKLTKDDDLYNNLTKTANSLNNLVDDMKANPKRYLNISVFGKNNKD